MRSAMGRRKVCWNGGMSRGHRTSHSANRPQPRQKKHGKRRGRHRRAAAHGLLMGAMLLGAQAKTKASSSKYSRDSLPVAEVTVTIDQFAALPAYLAYDDIIDAAALEHEINPDLIHAVI